MNVFAISTQDRSVRYKLSPSGDEVWNPTNGTFVDLYGTVSDMEPGVAAASSTRGQVDVYVLGAGGYYNNLFHNGIRHRGGSLASAIANT
jgi:hypothetical protein